MTREIVLTQNMVALIDDDDYDLVAKYTWHYHPDKQHKKGRAATWVCLGNKKKRRIYLHRLILNAPSDKWVDHSDGNPLNNRRANLRLCNPAENARNAKAKKSLVARSPYKGVSWLAKNRRWAARITVNRKMIFLGTYLTDTEAALAYDQAAPLYHGAFARLNFPCDSLV